MIVFVRAFLHRRAQRQAETKALRDAEHAAAIQLEHARAYGDLCASLGPSPASQQLAREIKEVRSGSTVSTAFNRRRAAKDRQRLSTSVGSTIIDTRRPPTTRT